MKNLYIIILIVISSFYCNEDNSDYKKTLDTLFNKINNVTQNGDIILIRGNGFFSHQIISILNEKVPLSHIGIIVKDNNEFSILHIMPDYYNNKLRKDSFYVFLEETELDSIIIVRCKNVSGNAIAYHANKYLNNDIAFDYSFDLNTTKKIYCTEFVWRVLLESLGKDIFTNKENINGKQILGFSPLLNQKYFKRIY